MTSEEEALLAQISQLAGQINRHKNQNSRTSSPASSDRGGRDSYGLRGRGAFRSRGGYRVARPVHRNRTLILNSNSAPDSPRSTIDITTETADSWVSRNDRHLQLINSNVYEKNTQARLSALDKTAHDKKRQKHAREQQQVLSHVAQLPSAASTSSTASTGSREITIDGIQFQVTKYGSKLVRLPGQIAIATPKTASVAGVLFYRTKNGNMYRQGIVKAHQKSVVTRKKDVPCRNFSTTGSCPKGPLCRYIHDPLKVAICKDFLAKGTCSSGDACDLAHDYSPQRVPTCLHFHKGTCTNPNCHYIHADLMPDAPFCRDFGLYGFCEKGADCTQRHSFECPDFSNTGVCKTKGCKLLHRERASVLRKKAAQASADGGDISSDDESMDDNDVDSDEVEEFIGEEDAPDFSEQKDFIQF